MNSIAEVHDYLRSNVKGALHVAGIVPAESADCTNLYVRIADMILAANHGLAEFIVRRISLAPSDKVNGRKKTWKAQLRRILSAYMSGLYSELDLADMFIAHPHNRVPCEVVLLNVDCMQRALSKAKNIARKNKKICGFSFFWRDDYWHAEAA